MSRERPSRIGGSVAWHRHAGPGRVVRVPPDGYLDLIASDAGRLGRIGHRGGGRLWDDGRMIGRPRWEDDTRFVGVGSAASLLPVVEAFVAAARDDGWVAEEPVLHLRPKLDAWLADAPAGLWRDVTLTTDGLWLVIDVTWTGDGRLRDLRADAYALLGSFAELDTFVTQRVEPKTRIVVFELATGLPEGHFAPHGHLVRLVVRGPVAERVADERRSISDTAPR